MSVFCIIDDKYVPLYRIVWISALPHYCGEADCQREGEYEVRLEQGEVVWAANQDERDAVLTALEQWGSEEEPGEGEGGAEGDFQ